MGKNRGLPVYAVCTTVRTPERRINAGLVYLYTPRVHFLLSRFQITGF